MLVDEAKVRLCPLRDNECIVDSCMWWRYDDVSAGEKMDKGDCVLKKLVNEPDWR